MGFRVLGVQGLGFGVSSGLTRFVHALGLGDKNIHGRRILLNCRNSARDPETESFCKPKTTQIKPTTRKQSNLQPETLKPTKP